jgi:5'-phosphate synthase pdxT subunit
VAERIGVLALQGDFAAHGRVLAGFGADVVLVRNAAQLDGLSALVFPGGESTTMSLLLDYSGLRAGICELVNGGLPVLATCAGTILLARELRGDSGSVKVQQLGLLDAVVDRNAYGRQADSFEAAVAVDWPALGLDGEAGDFRGVFIRAPQIIELGEGVRPVAHLGEQVVAVRQGKIIAAAFHPELAGDDRLHRALFALI